MHLELGNKVIDGQSISNANVILHQVFMFSEFFFKSFGWP